MQRSQFLTLMVASSVCGRCASIESTACAKDIFQVTKDFTNFGLDIAKLVKDCIEITKCAAGIGALIGELSIAATDIGLAAEDCSGATQQCVNAINTLSNAVQACSGHAQRIPYDCSHNPIACAADITALSTAGAVVIADVVKLSSACSGPPGPPVPPAPAPSWPTFTSSAALGADAWGAYYKAVYGELPHSYPLKVADNWMLYDKALVSARVTNIPKVVGNCPTANPPLGQRYNINNRYSPAFLSWAWHPYPYSSLRANTWAEVLHERDPFGDESFGAWFVYAPGSGIYFHIGKTIAFQEHSDAYHHFGVKGGNWNQELSKAAASRGYDSVQFLAHVDHVNYQCDTQHTGRAGLTYMGLEVVGVKLVGKYACGEAFGAPPSIKAGWRASKACTCDNSQPYLNCKGLPTLYANTSLRVPRVDALV